MSSTLSARLTEALDEAKEKDPTKSKSGLAKFCGVRPSTVTDWFSGKTRGITGEAAPKQQNTCAYRHDGFLVVQERSTRRQS